MEKQISDLEAKLAEKDKTIDNLIAETQDLKKTLQVVSGELIEKEKEIKRLNTVIQEEREKIEILKKSLHIFMQQSE